jgi:hypothetical protein
MTAVRRGLGQLLQPLKSYAAAGTAMTEKLPTAAFVALTLRAPPPLHQVSAALTSLRLFSARQGPACQPAAGAQRHGSRPYTTATPPEQQELPGSHVVAGQTLDEIRARIFGTHIGNGLRSGRKVLRGKLLGPMIASYYPEDLEKGDPLMVSIKAEKCVRGAGGGGGRAALCIVPVSSPDSDSSCSNLTWWTWWSLLQGQGQAGPDAAARQSPAQEGRRQAVEEVRGRGGGGGGWVVVTCGVEAGGGADAACVQNGAAPATGEHWEHGDASAAAAGPPLHLPLLPADVGIL